MNIPADLLERLVKLGESPEQFSDICKLWGSDYLIEFLQCYIKRREETVTLYREWAPRLRAYAIECRTKNRPPDSGIFSEQDRAKLLVYETKIKLAERLQPKDGASVLICSIPLIGVPVAQRLWPGEDSLSVILTPEELKKWQGIYKHPEEAYTWWIDYWWTIEERPDPNAAICRGRNIQVPQGESPWLVTSGLSWGPLAGDSTTELWSWNGSEARYVRNIAHLTS